MLAFFSLWAWKQWLQLTFGEAEGTQVLQSGGNESGSKSFFVALAGFPMQTSFFKICLPTGDLLFRVQFICSYHPAL